MALAGGGTLAAEERQIIVQGRVVGEGGEGIADWPVSLIGTRRYVELMRFSSGGDVKTVAATTTDRSGYFSISVPRVKGFQYWFVRFMPAEGFDPVKYLPPQDVEITRDARKGRLAEVQITVQYHPDWSEVGQRVAELGGPDTPKGRILLSLGLPEKIVTRDPSEEEWWYFEQGVMYTFRGAEEMSTRRFEPVRPPSVDGASDGEGT